MIIHDAEGPLMIHDNSWFGLGVLGGSLRRHDPRDVCGIRGSVL